MAELSIDNNVVELGNTKLVFSKAGYSFYDWLTKDLPYSERVTLPETSLLNSIFFRPDSPDITGKKFSKFHTFKYKDNGKIVFSGIANLLKFNENKEYEIQLIDSSFNLFENLKGKLKDLDLEDSDFTFNSTAYSTLKVLNSSAWIWSASSMHDEKILSKNILNGNLAFSRPFFSAKRLIEKMFSDNGWTYQLGVNCDTFDKFIISAKNEFVFTSYEKKYNTILISSTIDLSSPDFLKTDTLTGSTILNLTYNSKLRLRGNLIADNDFTITISVTGTNPQTQTFIVNKGDFDYDFTSNEITAGDAVSIAISGTGNLELIDFLIYTIINENDFGTMSSANFVDFKVKTYDNLPDIVQKELFKHCLVEIGGFFTSNNFNKILSINSILSLSNLGSVDWSDKFVEDTNQHYPLDGYGQTNYFTYKNSSDKPENLGRGIFILDNETLPSTKQIYESIFEASNEVTITNSMIDNTVYNDTERFGEINTLIGYYEEISTYTVARFDELNGNSILNKFYPNFVKAIQKGEIMESKFNLNKSDFFLFDFTKLVYLKQKKSVFFCLGINNYTENKLTDVLLLKV